MNDILSFCQFQKASIKAQAINNDNNQISCGHYSVPDSLLPCWKFWLQLIKLTNVSLDRSNLNTAPNSMRKNESPVSKYSLELVENFNPESEFLGSCRKILPASSRPLATWNLCCFGRQQIWSLLVAKLHPRKKIVGEWKSAWLLRVFQNLPIIDQIDGRDDSRILTRKGKRVCWKRSKVTNWNNSNMDE